MIELANKIASDKLHQIEQQKKDELRRENAELRAILNAILTTYYTEIEVEHGKVKFCSGGQSYDNSR